MVKIKLYFVKNENNIKRNPRLILTEVGALDIHSFEHTVVIILHYIKTVPSLSLLS